MKTITQFFKQDLAAPLKNQQWSWGALDDGGQVFLRVWQKDWEHRARRSLVIGPNWKPQSAGHNERIRQLALVDAGARGFLVVCDGHFDEAHDKMVIKSYRDDVVFPITAIERAGETIHARWTDPVAVASLRD